MYVLYIFVGGWRACVQRSDENVSEREGFDLVKALFPTNTFHLAKRDKLSWWQKHIARTKAAQRNVTLLYNAWLSCTEFGSRCRRLADPPFSNNENGQTFLSAALRFSRRVNTLAVDAVRTKPKQACEPSETRPVTIDVVRWGCFFRCFFFVAMTATAIVVRFCAR